MIKLKILAVPHVAELEVEAGSIEEAVSLLNDGGSEVIHTFFKGVLSALMRAQTDVRTVASGSALTLPTTGDTPQTPAQTPLDGSEAVEGAEAPEQSEAQDGKPKRVRRTKAQIAADEAAEAAAKASPPPVVATAPAPMPVPGTATPPPLAGAPAPGLNAPAFVGTSSPVDTNVTGIPAILDRKQNGLAPPPPPAPPSPPAPPVCNLGRKVADNLKARGESPELLAWVVGTGICQPGSKWDEALGVFLFTSDDKVAPIANALGLAA
jgi:hypothetical protein